MHPMRSVARIVAVVALVAGLTSVAPRAQAQSKSDPNGLGKKTMQLYDAMKANDVAALDAMLAPSFTFTNYVGVKGTRADYLAVFTKKLMVIDKYKLDPDSVTITGDKAVVMYHLAITAHVGKNPWPPTLVSVDTWVKQGAGWLLAERHSSVPAAK